VAKLLDEVWCRGVFVVGLVDPGWMDGLALNLTQEEQVSKTARVHVDYIHMYHTVRRCVVSSFGACLWVVSSWRCFFSLDGREAITYA